MELTIEDFYPSTGRTAPEGATFVQLEDYKGLAKEVAFETPEGRRVPGVVVFFPLNTESRRFIDEFKRESL